MNSDKRNLQSRKINRAGNAMIYVLLALALLAALTLTLGRQADTGGDNISRDQAELLALETISYAGSVKNTIDQMMMTGSQVANLSYARPQDGVSFDNPPHINKVFHPGGGGLAYKQAEQTLFSGNCVSATAGWYLGRFNNIAWTPSTANDVVLAACGLSQAVCESINKKITGSTAIPAIGGTGIPAIYLIAQAQRGGAANANLTTTECAACDGYPSLCVSSNSGGSYTYYSIISGQ